MNRFLCFLGATALLSVIAFTGCETTGGTSGKTGVSLRPPPVASDVLRKDDLIVITFANLPTSAMKAPHEEKIKDDGMITPPEIGPVKAEGKTAGQLQKEIQDAYVPKLYRRMTVTVRPPERFFFVQGEVKIPNRYQITPGMTVLKAITTAGGFTDFAKKTEVEVTGISGERYVIDCKAAQKKPSLDLPLYPDDRVNVPKRFY